MPSPLSTVSYTVEEMLFLPYAVAYSNCLSNNELNRTRLDRVSALNFLLWHIIMHKRRLLSLLIVEQALTLHFLYQYHPAKP